MERRKERWPKGGGMKGVPVTNGRFLEEGGGGWHAPTRLTRCRTPRDAALSRFHLGRPVNRLYLHLDPVAHAT